LKWNILWGEVIERMVGKISSMEMLNREKNRENVSKGEVTWRMVEE
jgi:hypothetical protein